MKEKPISIAEREGSTDAVKRKGVFSGIERRALSADRKRRGGEED